MPEEPKVEELLNSKKRESESNINQIASLMKTNNDLKAEIAKLDKKVKDVQQASNSYTQLLQKIEEEKKYAKRKTAMIKEEIKYETKGRITKDIEKIDKKKIKLKEDEDELRDEVKKFKGEKEDAQEELEKKQKNYETLKNSPKAIEGDIKDLKGKIEQYEKENKTASQYFLIEELNKILDNPKPPEDLNSELYEAQDDIDKANTVLKEKDEKLKESQTNLEQKRKARGEFNHRDEILKLLNKY